ncbi:ABC transporter substrate-binding protein [Paraglaciecola sp.]|uniref:ABC transporter substrate-binding protein n=1 Tax=Paraglaciecola sp. TaxID=1920173 RepID=UPI00273E4235|nr:extracellular solute-binding protein [Paraglaciecola sp.]MDP5030153.1 extracellular solute-binding protein [Paraglaciecola sp.]
MFIFCADVFPKELRIALSISNSAQRMANYALISDFEAAYPDINVSVTAFTSEVYKEKFPTFLANKHFDVLYWHAGERLFEYIKQGEVTAITELYHQNALLEVFDQSVVRSVSLQAEIYALPMSYYQIGFYYNTALFTKLGIEAPNTWTEFLEVCAALKKNNVPPIFIGSKSNWPATAWFDYLNLRINGLYYHQQLLRGETSFLEPKVRDVFTKLKTLIEAGYFISDHQQYDWKQGIAPLFRGMTGMVMFGNYAIQDFPQAKSTEIGFFKFPLFDGKQDEYFEEVPLDVLLIPSISDKKQLAETFLKFASKSENQQRFNQTLGIISPNKFAQVNNSELVQKAYDVIANSSGISQFFDRDAKSEFAEKTMPIIDAFLSKPDIESTLIQLEKVRFEVFP